MSTDLSLFLLFDRGTLASPTLEAARKLHNSTAGAPANIAAAKIPRRSQPYGLCADGKRRRKVRANS